MVAFGLVFAVLLAALPGQEAARVFVEVLSSPEAYESQPVDVVIRIGYDAAWFEEHGVALIRQEVDVPFHLMVPWLLASPGRDVRLVPFEGEFGMARVPVGDQVVAGMRQLQTTREGRTSEGKRASSMQRCKYNGGREGSHLPSSRRLAGLKIRSSTW